MLKAIETLAMQKDVFNLTDNDIQTSQVNLLSALKKSEKNEDVIAVFAHGHDVFRVIKLSDPPQRKPYWAIQIWSLFLHSWITHYKYPLEKRQNAITFAAQYYPTMSCEEAMIKWPSASNSNFVMCYEQLIEFFYDTQLIDWPNGTPWPINQLLAETLIAYRGILVEDFSFAAYAVRFNLDAQMLEQEILSVLKQEPLLIQLREKDSKHAKSTYYAI